MTEIQRKSIGHALAGRDVLGCAETGSGKTLSFLIPCMECLYRNKWSKEDGLGVLVLTPTRELAIQIFSVLAEVGIHHDFSAASLIGGRNVDKETSVINDINFIVATPGRLLQHFEETPNFNADSLQIVVLDESDRMLDLGFEKDVNAIFKNLPKDCQTLLFSATLREDVSHLARLSLKQPVIIDVNKSGPNQLKHFFMTVQLADKPSVLFSFLKTHRQAKILVFVTTTKQCRFLYEVMSRLLTGLRIDFLSGRRAAKVRSETFEKFQRRKDGVLIATDVASRGLDIKDIDWVLQYDCPEDLDAYIHRAGRTARYIAQGCSLLFLSGPEVRFVEQLVAKKIEVLEVAQNPRTLIRVDNDLGAMLARDQELSNIAKKTFFSYKKAIKLCDKESFENMDLAAFASSLGLPVVPGKRAFNEIDNNDELLVPTGRSSPIFQPDQDVKRIRVDGLRSKKLD